ncbi:hypothetical protein BV25DRAFT_1914541 [Artomyces pyxidatus]|uniref:Uncharacterized protein n=1 Tax=Artomyces pyxidatus TaxID=48021 RepID=A0ACB8T7U8_9AGAM|nr:hypothetical protein BV25DRAFT_1914541 [Artomyces pyxidatus]
MPKVPVTRVTPYTTELQRRIPCIPDKHNMTALLNPRNPGGVQVSVPLKPTDGSVARESYHPMLRCAKYGADMLGSAFAVHHALVHLVIGDHDDVLWIWWYDTQGAIQSTGINFILDFPRFLVLLLAYQRFSLEDWGRIPALDASAVAAHTGQAPFDQVRSEIPYTVSFEEKALIFSIQRIIYARHALSGRGTCVLAALSSSDHYYGDPQTSRMHLGNIPPAVKIIWADRSRISEGEMVKQAFTRAKGNLDVIGPLPNIIHGCEFFDSFHRPYSTATIRERLNFPSRGDGRVLRLFVSEELYPITELMGKAFVRAWLEIVKCHYALWTLGIQHCDPSLNNLMVRRQHDGTPVGVLNDWDLAHIQGFAPTLGTLEKTGTLPFMPLDLLKLGYFNGEKEHLYRHDLESLIWILPWTLMRYRYCKLLKHPPLAEWETPDYKFCHDSKVAFLSDGANLEVDLSWASEWMLAGDLLMSIRVKHVKRTKRREVAARNRHLGRTPGPSMAGLADGTEEERKDEDVYNEFWEVIKGVAKQEASSSYCATCVPDAA